MTSRTTSRTEFIALAVLLTSLTGISLDAILPAMPNIVSDLGLTNANRVQLVVTMFAFGMVFGELVFGPISDAYGRKPAILVGLVIYCLGAGIAMSATSLEQMLVGRIVQGIGVSGSKIGARALVRDQFAGPSMAQVMSIIFGFLILVPMVAPALGQLLLLVANWQAIFVLYLLVAALAALWLVLRQRETLSNDRRIPIEPRSLWLNAVQILRHPLVMAYTVAAGLIFGAQLLFFATAHPLIAEVYGRGASFPVYFAALAFGSGAASFVNSRMVKRADMTWLVSRALLCLAGLSFGLLAIGGATGGVPPFGVFFGVMFGQFACVGILFGNVNAIAMQVLGRIAGLGASVIASVSSLIAVVYSTGIGWFYSGTVYPVAIGFLLAALASLAITGAVRNTARLEIVPMGQTARAPGR